jgi:hypothetical protein
MEEKSNTSDALLGRCLYAYVGQHGRLDLQNCTLDSALPVIFPALQDDGDFTKGSYFATSSTPTPPFTGFELCEEVPFAPFASGFI